MVTSRTDTFWYAIKKDSHNFETKIYEQNRASGFTIEMYLRVF